MVKYLFVVSFLLVSGLSHAETKADKDANLAECQQLIATAIAKAKYAGASDQLLNDAARTGDQLFYQQSKADSIIAQSELFIAQQQALKICK